MYVVYVWVSERRKSHDIVVYHLRRQSCWSVSCSGSEQERIKEGNGDKP